MRCYLDWRVMEVFCITCPSVAKYSIYARDNPKTKNALKNAIWDQSRARSAWSMFPVERLEYWNWDVEAVSSRKEVGEGFAKFSPHARMISHAERDEKSNKKLSPNFGLVDVFCVWFLVSRQSLTPLNGICHWNRTCKQNRHREKWNHGLKNTSNDSRTQV